MPAAPAAVFTDAVALAADPNAARLPPPMQIVKRPNRDRIRSPIPAIVEALYIRA